MTKHKTEDYKKSAVKYYLNNDKGYDTNKLVKYLIVRNLHYDIGLKDTKLLKILQEETENKCLMKQLNHKN
jgi:hypothetical protein